MWQCRAMLVRFSTRWSNADPSSRTLVSGGPGNRRRGRTVSVPARTPAKPFSANVAAAGARAGLPWHDTCSMMRGEVCHDHFRTGPGIGDRWFAGRSGLPAMLPWPSSRLSGNASARGGCACTPCPLPRKRQPLMPRGRHSIADPCGSWNSRPHRGRGGRGGPSTRPDQGLRPGYGPRKNRRGFLPAADHPGRRREARPATGTRQAAGRGDSVRPAPVPTAIGPDRLPGRPLLSPGITCS